MKIAILGAGYTGLACAWHLLHSPIRPRGLHLTLIDEKSVGGGASGIAAGLLHSFVGLHAKINWRGFEAMQATRHLIEQSALALGRPVASATGLLRIALSEEQEKNYRRTAEENSDVEWWEPQRCKDRVISLEPHRGGIYISSGQTVFSSDYLQGLWRSCQLQGAEQLQMAVESLGQLKHYDRIIVAAGAGTAGIEELAELPITLVKGQLLDLEWPEGVPPLPFAVNSQSYVVMNPDNKSCVAGATYERDYEALGVDVEAAKREIFPKLPFLPFLQNAPVLRCRAAFRVSTKGHLPITKQINSRTWALTGMGSKGLLYHALLARELSEVVLSSR